MTTFLSTHAALIAQILAGIVALDHLIDSIPDSVFPANSTGGTILLAARKALDFLATLNKPAG